MKNNHAISFTSFVFAILICFSLQAQDNSATETGYPGDHFSLEGALDLFEKAKSPEDFEKLLNTEDNNVNNLDLNEDGDIDYIRVVDNMEGDVHAIVLQVPVSKTESQDIAVIEIEKTGKESAILQIIGDETIYGEQKIVEPFEEAANGGKGGPSVNMATVKRVVIVWHWPCVRFIYAPGYRVWRSPWYWGYYPGWWRPWRPRPWRSFYNTTLVFRPRFRVVSTHRVVKAHRVYTPKRKTSKVVHTRTTTRVAVKGKNGKVGVAKTTTGVAKGKNGQVSGKRSTTKVGVKGKNGNVVAGKKTTTTKRAAGKRGSVTKRHTTTAGAKKSRGGAVAGKKKTTVTKRRKN